VQAFDVLADPVRRRILELLAGGESASGSVVDVIHREFGISQPAVSQHLKVLRENGFATVRIDGARRLYSVDHGPLRDVDAWLEPFRRAWETPVGVAGILDALATEVARGKRSRRSAGGPVQGATPGSDGNQSGETPPFIDEMRSIS
jgi:DNA-binding transcriptional ArsR family regulator